MKKYLKNLLVVAVALMPSLSINTFAQPSGNDPEIIPVKETPSPNPGTGPRIMSNGPSTIPVRPKPNPNPNPNPKPGGPRIMSVDPDVIPIKPVPGGDIPLPRIASAEPEEIPIKSPSDSYPRPRMRSAEPDDIPVIPDPNTNPGGGPRFRNSVQTPHCYHIDGVVYIDADATITYINASVTRYDDNQVWSDASNTNTLSITTSAAPGSYLLELTLSTGQSYKGKYIIE
ncbi:MAG: hypothetical protein IKO33_04825 [Bacteroidaceae bacterium]|nr:hypothetical protein [Bacteroidaceae bacterium]